MSQLQMHWHLVALRVLAGTDLESPASALIRCISHAVLCKFVDVAEQANPSGVFTAAHTAINSALA